MSNFFGKNAQLGRLGKAVGANSTITGTTRLAQDGKGSASQTSMGQFMITNVNGPALPDTTPNEGSSTVCTINFGGFVGTNGVGVSEGAFGLVSRWRNRAANFTWAENTNANFFTLTTNSDFTAPITFGTVSSPTSCTLTCKFEDDFNINALGYGQTISKFFTIQNVTTAPPSGGK